jgi:hypothetical protein
VDYTAWNLQLADGAAEIAGRDFRVVLDDKQHGQTPVDKTGSG